MKRTRIMGLALVAAFAFSALAAASAFAKPEIIRCYAKTGGKYTESNCKTKSTSKSPGSFEISKVPVKKGFTSSGGEGTLETANGTKVICSTQSATGEYKSTTSTKEVTNVISKFNGCGIPALGLTCNTAGDAAGEITTNKLGGKLGYISGKGSKTPVVGQELHPLVKKGSFTSFECGGGAVKVIVGEGAGKGGDCIIAPVGPANVSSTTVTQEYSGSGGKQNPQHFEGSTKTCNLESNTNGGAYERATQALVTTVTNEEALEINA